MNLLATRAWSGVIAVLDTPSSSGGALLAPPEGEQWWKVPMPLYTAVGTGCGHLDIHHVGQVESVERRGNLLRGAGWVCTMHPDGFLTVPAELFAAPEAVPGELPDNGDWRITSVYLHPTHAVWPDAKIRHFLHPNGPVRKMCEPSRHVDETGAEVQLPGILRSFFDPH